MRNRELALFQWNCQCVMPNGHACVAVRPTREAMMLHLVECHHYKREDFEHFVAAITERGGYGPADLVSPEPVEPQTRQLAGVH